jgi:hypothetical protein
MTRPFRFAMSARRGPTAPPSAFRTMPIARQSAKLRHCDYTAPAGLFIRESTHLRYQPFATVAAAVRYANEELDMARLRSCTLEVDDASFQADEVRALYAADVYPLTRRRGKDRPNS